MLYSIRLLLPALIPSWRFFDVIAPSPRIEFALQHAPQEWQEFRPRPARLSFATMLGRMFYNAPWNESLFLVTCAERLMAWPSDHSANEISTRIAAQLGQGEHFQFRLVFIGREGNELHEEVAYISPLLKGGRT